MYIVVSFSDSTGGTIYAASNFVKTGVTGSSTFYRDGDGRLRHPRQNGVNISKSEAATMGWTAEKRAAKTRWHYPLGYNRKHTAKLRKELLSRSQEV